VIWYGQERANDRTATTIPKKKMRMRMKMEKEGARGMKKKRRTMKMTKREDAMLQVNELTVSKGE